MIKDIKLWEKFEKEFSRNEKPDYHKNIKIFNELRKQAILMKVIPPIDTLENIEVKVRISKILNKLK